MKVAIYFGNEEQAVLKEGLEAVADAEDELVRVPEAAQIVAQEMGQLVGKNLACSYIITVREPPWDHEQLEAVQEARLLAQAVDGQTPFGGTGLFGGEFCLTLAVCAASAKNQVPRPRPFF